MDSSPKGREIEPLVGNGGAIISRGNEITDLGDKMISSAGKLESIADGASGQKGLAVKKLQDVVGDCYKELKLAGERYKPTGPALVTYGDAVDDVQPKIKSIVADCEDDWTTYTTKAGAIPSVTVPTAVPSGTSPSDDGSAQKQAEQEREDAQGAAEDAYEVWKDDAQTFDTYYDTWEDAFDTAVKDIGKANDGGIEDGFWDDVDGFVAAALEVLKWVGIALAVLCIIIGGPVLLALAAIAAVATLGLTIYSYCRGNSTLTDLIFAAVGIIPFGSAGKLFQAGKRLEFLDDMVGGLGKPAARMFSHSGRQMILGEVRTAATSISAGFSGGLRTGLRSTYSALGGPGGTNIISRAFTGQNTADLLGPGASNISNVAGIFGDFGFKTVFGIPDSLFDIHNNMGKPADAPVMVG